MIRATNAGNVCYRIKRMIAHWLSINYAKPTASTAAVSYLERSRNMTGQPAPDVYKRCLMCKEVMPGIMLNQGLLAPRQICYDCECYYSDNGGNAA